MDYKKIIASADTRLFKCDKKSAPLYSMDGITTAGKCYQVYDADTCRIAIKIHDEIISWKVRIQHFDAAEMRTKDPVEKELALVAKARTKELIDGKVCCVKFGKFDKYGRSLVEITNPDGLDVATVLLTEQLAYPYEGNTKNCDWITLETKRQEFLADKARSEGKKVE